MTAKTSDWRPGPTVCRCCLTEGCYKDISTEYFWMGKREVYAEMLSDTLNISIAYSKSGPNSNSRLICEPCISRLRDAHDFRRQVTECEKTFMQHLDPGSSSVQNEVELTLQDVKIERVKVEKNKSDDEDDFDDRIDFVVNDDTDDELDNEPLMKLATKVPKKEVEILDLLDTSQITVKRKSQATTSKSKEPPAKKSKKLVIKPSARTPKPTASASKTVEKKKKEQIPACTQNRVMSGERQNAKIIIQNSTVYPFKMPRSTMVCIYCDEEFEEPPLFRQHMRENHESATALYPRLIKVDSTELNCRVCLQSFDDIQSIAEHLKSLHRYKIDLNSGFGLVPFSLPNRQWMCTFCKLKTPTLRALSKHMTVAHFSSVTCEECGKTFANTRSLDLHVDFSHKKIIKCKKCRETFTTTEERSHHYRASTSCWQSVCHICNMRFMSDNPKEKHMQEVHNIFSKNLTCTDCGESFPNSKECLKHFRIAHTDDKLCCAFCPKMFVSKARLIRHTVTHTKEKLFSCNVCDKAFVNQSVLNQHMWLHREDKRFKCKFCNKQFNQKVTLITHMKSCHPMTKYLERGIVAVSNVTATSPESDAHGGHNYDIFSETAK